MQMAPNRSTNSFLLLYGEGDFGLAMLKEFIDEIKLEFLLGYESKRTWKIQA